MSSPLFRWFLRNYCSDSFLKILIFFLIHCWFCQKQTFPHRLICDHDPEVGSVLGSVNTALCLFISLFLTAFHWGRAKERRRRRERKKDRGEKMDREERGERKKGKRAEGSWGITHFFLQKKRRRGRYEYSDFTLLIRDGCLFLWGKALLVFVSSLITCMMYSTVLYSVMGERWRSGRLTMRPKGLHSRHSQLYSRQRSKATLFYPKLVTISLRKNSPPAALLTALLPNKAIFPQAVLAKGRLLFWDHSL